MAGAIIFEGETEEHVKRIAVIGAGSWGAALSLVLARKDFDLSLWVWDPKQSDIMRTTRENPYLPGFPIPENVQFTTEIGEAAEGADAVVFVVISAAAEEVARRLKPFLRPGIPVVSATKGLSDATGLTISQTLECIIGPDNPVAAISGPNLAVEVARQVPSATVAACADLDVAHQVQNMLMCPSLRVYTNQDIIGVELAGALKNVIAIAAGICDGMGFGDNTKAALLTRGLAEITRLGTKIGANPSTFIGLAGVGDLITTCASPLSRNRRVGLGLGQGRKLDDICREIGQVAEGVPTTRAAYDLARKHDTPMPITEQVYQVLFEDKDPKAALADLMSREPKDEVW
jgi:glycerol-3-phosphate dehydrogenase (NAD(P)+)